MFSFATFFLISINLKVVVGCTFVPLKWAMTSTPSMNCRYCIAGGTGGVLNLILVCTRLLCGAYLMILITISIGCSTWLVFYCAMLIFIWVFVSLSLLLVLAMEWLLFCFDTVLYVASTIKSAISAGAIGYNWRYF